MKEKCERMKKKSDLMRKRGCIEDLTHHFLVFISRHEVLSEKMAGEQVYEIVVSQRTEAPLQYPSKCATCFKSGEQTKLKRCIHCLKVAYCNS